jgi:hypothetical protein
MAKFSSYSIFSTSQVLLLISAMFLVQPATGVENAASPPDFSGTWAHSTFGHEQPPSGPGPVTTMKPPPQNGFFDDSANVGDYTNAILKPEAAAIVKKLGEMSLSGNNFPDPSNQCAPQSPPYVFAVQQGLQMLQDKDQVTILYNLDNQVRRVRLNTSHPEHATPSAMGDSVGHYEGDTLVIDTVGIKVGPTTMVDLFGTPQSEALHLIERYRLIDAAEAKVAAERHLKIFGRGPGSINIDAAYSKGLQLEFTVEDPVFFTMPWSAQITYQRSVRQWQENVCAESTIDYYNGKQPARPTAEKPDF